MVTPTFDIVGTARRHGRVASELEVRPGTQPVGLATGKGPCDGAAVPRGTSG